jgi:hypothetical protein
MSTKIWVAWRAPIIRINEVAEALRPLFLDRAYKVFRQIALALEERLDAEREQIRDIDVMEVTHRTRRFIVSANAKTVSNPFDISCGCQMYFDETYVYLIPYGFIDTQVPDWFEDFHYQNQTDQPDDISDEEWKFRANKWKEVCFNHTSILHLIPRYKVKGEHRLAWLGDCSSRRIGIHL